MKAVLVIGVDVGLSLTKGPYSYLIEGEANPQVGFKTVCSMVRKLTKAKYSSMLNTVDDNSSLVAFDNSYWLIGNAARGETLKLSATQHKYETAIAKTLALVGQLMTEIHLQGVDEVHVTVGILLPMDEWGDRFALQDRLEQALWEGEFEFNGTPLRTAMLNGIHISPEGYGITRMIEAETGGVFIFGHRDVSFLQVDNGSITEGKSKTFAGWGMQRLIKEVDYTFKDELQAAALIFAAGETLKDKYLLQLCNEGDLLRLKAAIAEAREQLWLDLCGEFQSTSYRLAEQVICSGGNAYYWQTKLKELLGSRFDGGVGLRREMEARFPALRGSPLLFRGADIYRFALTLPGFPAMDLVGCANV
jgi:hypothetical protein